uniref:Small ribosomal subunit protein mS26 n=1 Tax=Rhipicephalus pulchellus TaxID=72859 RepID=L7M4U0_RHIPC
MLSSVLPKAVMSPLRSAACDAAFHRSDVSLVLGLQQVRWKKTKGMKPRWMPIAPSKLFKINLGPPKDPEELAVLQRLTSAYRTEMKAIRNFWMEEHQKDLELVDKHSALSQEEEREHERLLEENEKENQRVAVLRMERNKLEEARRVEELLKREAEAKVKLAQLKEQVEEQRVAVLRMERNKLEEARRVEELLKREAEAKVKLAQLKEQVEEIVKLEKKRSSTYVTLENLDEAIEFAIENPISYSFAIDQQGKEIWEGTPHYELYKQGPAHAYALPERKQF